MEYKLHVPVEQYGFVEATMTGNAEDARREYSRIKESFVDGEGLNGQEWAKFRNNYMSTGTITDELTYSKLSKWQKSVINQIKLGLNQFDNEKIHTN